VAVLVPEDTIRVSPLPERQPQHLQA